VPEPWLELRNVGDRTWNADGVDSDHVRVWALGPDGERLTVDHAALSFFTSPVHRVPTLEAGERVELIGRWQPLIEDLPAGDYALEAQLRSLEVNCSAGRSAPLVA
jgi:hypothetical protein